MRLFDTTKNHSKKTFHDWHHVLKKIYERREIIEIKWTDDKNNSIDVMIKKNLFNALKHFISTNTISVKTSKWIERKKSSNWIDTENDKNFTFSINHHISKIKIEIKTKIENQNRFFTYSEFSINWDFCVQNQTWHKILQRKRILWDFFSSETFFESSRNG